MFNIKSKIYANISLVDNICLTFVVTFGSYLNLNEPGKKKMHTIHENTRKDNSLELHYNPKPIGKKVESFT